MLARDAPLSTAADSSSSSLTQTSPSLLSQSNIYPIGERRMFDGVVVGVGEDKVMVMAVNKVTTTTTTAANTLLSSPVFTGNNHNCNWRSSAAVIPQQPRQSSASTSSVTAELSQQPARVQLAAPVSDMQTRFPIPVDAPPSSSSSWVTEMTSKSPPVPCSSSPSASSSISSPNASSPPPLPSLSNPSSSSSPRPLVYHNSNPNEKTRSSNVNLITSQPQSQLSQSQSQPHPHPHPHMFSLFPSSSSRSQSTSTQSDSGESSTTTLSASHNSSSDDSHPRRAYVMRMQQPRRRAPSTATTTPTNGVTASSASTTAVVVPSLSPPSPSCVRFTNNNTNTTAIATTAPTAALIHKPKVPSSSTGASTTASVSNHPPAGMGAAQPPQLERRTSQVTSFSSISSDDADATRVDKPTHAHAQPSSPLDHSGAGSSTPRRKQSITTSKSALELLTKGRITSNLAIYKPRELWKPDAHAEKCDSLYCSKSFLLPFASSLGSIPFPSLSSLSSISSFLSSSTSSSSSAHGGSGSSPQSNTLVGGPSSISASVSSSSTSGSSSSPSMIMTTTQPITLLRSRHHCRMCGGVFCTECTAFKAALLDTRNMPWLFVPEGHDLLDVPVPVPGSSSATGASMENASGGEIGIGSTVVEGVRRASEGLVCGLRRRATQIVTPSSSSDAAPPAAGEPQEGLASEQDTTAADDEIFPSSFMSSSSSLPSVNSTSSPIKRRKSSLAAIVSSYTPTATTSTTTAAAAAKPLSSSPSSTTATAPSPSAYRTPQQHPASPSNPNPPTFSLPLHRASTSLAASALPESEPLVRVERICIGCAALLRGAAGKGRSAIPSLKSNAASNSSSGASGVGGVPSTPATPTFASVGGGSGISRTNSFSSFVGFGVGVSGGGAAADAVGGRNSFGSNEESERAREEIRAFRERLDSGTSSITSAPSPSLSNPIQTQTPMIAANTSSSSLSTRRRRSRVHSADSDTIPSIPFPAIGGEALTELANVNMRRNSSLSSLVTATSSSIRRSSPPLTMTTTMLPQHTFSPAVSSPLSPTPRSPRSSRFIISPSNAVHHHHHHQAPLPHTHSLALGLASAGVDPISGATVNGSGVLPKRTQSVLLPPPSFLPAIPEPADDVLVSPLQTAANNNTVARKKSALGGGVRPGMRRAHSSNEVDHLPRAANVATSNNNNNNNKGAAGSPLARASSLRTAGTGRASSLCAGGTGNDGKRLPPKGKHIAWLPSSGSSFSPSSVDSVKPSPLRMAPAFPLPLPPLLPSSSSSSSPPASTSLVGSPESAATGTMIMMESGQTSLTVAGGASTPTTIEAITPVAAAATAAISPSAVVKLKKERSPSPTSTLYGRPKPGQISLREVLQQTLGSDEDEEEDEVDVTISQDKVMALTRSMSSVTSLSSSSQYSHDQDHESLDWGERAGSTMAVFALGGAFPASPPVQRHDKPVLYAPFGNGAAPAPGLLAAATSRIITPSLPPSLIEPREPKPLTPAPTPPITRAPSTAELTKQRADAYAAHARYEEDLAARRRLAAVLPTHHNHQPFGFMAAAGIVGGVITAGVDPAVTEKKLFGTGAYGRGMEDDVCVPAAPTQTRRDLVKPLYAMTLSTF